MLKLHFLLLFVCRSTLHCFTPPLLAPRTSVCGRKPRVETVRNGPSEPVEGIGDTRSQRNKYSTLTAVPKDSPSLLIPIPFVNLVIFRVSLTHHFPPIIISLCTEVHPRFFTYKGSDYGWILS